MTDIKYEVDGHKATITLNLENNNGERREFVVVASVR